MTLEIFVQKSILLANWASPCGQAGRPSSFHPIYFPNFTHHPQVPTSLLLYALGGCTTLRARQWGHSLSDCEPSPLVGPALEASGIRELPLHLSGCNTQGLQPS